MNENFKLVDDKNILRIKSVDMVPDKDLCDHYKKQLTAIAHTVQWCYVEPIACIEVGIPIRFGIVTRGKLETDVFINTRIIAAGGLVSVPEDCISLQDLGEHYIVRPNAIVIENTVWDEEKSEFKRVVSRHYGEVARAIQHLINHWDGILISDLIKRARVGRNDPCPCGSNKKYKKCCG